MCEKQEPTLLDKLLIELCALACDIKAARTAQGCFDMQLKMLRAYCPEVFAEILRVTTTPEAEVIDITFEYV